MSSESSVDVIDCSPPLYPKPWARDSTECSSCNEKFGTFSKTYGNCFGCGKAVCSDCITSAVLEQYESLDEHSHHSCRDCASPYINVAKLPVLSTRGGSLTFPLFNVTRSSSTVEVFWGGNRLESVTFEPSSKLVTVQVPEGSGVVEVKIADLARLTSATFSTHYEPPLIHRSSPLSTEGTDSLVIFGDNFGADESAISATIDGVPVRCSLKAPHQKLLLSAPEGTGVCRVRISVNGVTAEHEVVRAAPTILSVEPPDVDLQGGVVTLIGSSLGGSKEDITVSFPDFPSVPPTDIFVFQPHRKIRCVVPPLPEGALPGRPIRIRVSVGGLTNFFHSNLSSSEFLDMENNSKSAVIDPSVLYYSPPAGVPPSSGFAGYKTRRYCSAGVGDLDVPSPYANLFSTELLVDSARPALLSSSSTSSVLQPIEPTAASEASPALGSGKKVKVGGTLNTAGGPAFSVTPESEWVVDAPDCAGCGDSFNFTRRRHHCRVCGACVCGNCSKQRLVLQQGKEAQRICDRCHIRVGLLHQMTSVIDSIKAVKKVLPPEMFLTFQQEVIDAVSEKSDMSRSFRKEYTK